MSQRRLRLRELEFRPSPSVTGPERVVPQLMPARGLDDRYALSQPGDSLEVEADAVADRIMEGNGRAPVVGHAGPGSLVHRKCACGGSTGRDSGEEKCEKCAAEETQEEKARHPTPVQRAAAGPAPAGNVADVVAPAMSGNGAMLDRATRAFMEPRFGHDFSRVRVHTEASATASARALGARAYTIGEHVVFGAGEFAPATAAGRRLLAHELAHVVQQERGA